MSIGTWNMAQTSSFACSLKEWISDSQAATSIWGDRRGTRMTCGALESHIRIQTCSAPWDMPYFGDKNTPYEIHQNFEIRN